jgi:hypothetical protein
MRENNWIEYEDCKKIGEGTYIRNIKEGIWHETRSGCWSGVERIGEYKNGLKQGKWVDGNKHVSARMFYVNDTLEGYYIRWVGSGKKYVLEEGNYIHGLRDGQWLTFDAEHMKENSFWQNGMPGKTIVYERTRDELSNKITWLP